jgi:hypothetical protein
VKVSYTRISYENETQETTECESLRHDVHTHTGAITLTFYETWQGGQRMFKVVSGVMLFSVVY